MKRKSPSMDNNLYPQDNSNNKRVRSSAPTSSSSPSPIYSNATPVLENNDQDDDDIITNDDYVSIFDNRAYNSFLFTSEQTSLGGRQQRDNTLFNVSDLGYQQPQQRLLTRHESTVEDYLNGDGQDNDLLFNCLSSVRIPTLDSDIILPHDAVETNMILDPAEEEDDVEEISLAPSMQTHPPAPIPSHQQQQQQPIQQSQYISTDQLQEWFFDDPIVSDAAPPPLIPSSSVYQSPLPQQQIQPVQQRQQQSLTPIFIPTSITTTTTTTTKTRTTTRTTVNGVTSPGIYPSGNSPKAGASPTIRLELISQSPSSPRQTITKQQTVSIPVQQHQQSCEARKNSKLFKSTSGNTDQVTTNPLLDKYANAAWETDMSEQVGFLYTWKARIVSNPQSEILYISDSLREDLGYTEQEISTIKYPQLFHPHTFQRTLDFHLKNMLYRKPEASLDNIELIRKGYEADDPEGKLVAKMAAVKYHFDDKTNGMVGDVSNFYFD